MPCDTYDMTVRVRDRDRLVFEGRSDAPGDTRGEAEAAMRDFWTLFHKDATIEITESKPRPKKPAAPPCAAADGAVGAELHDAAGESPGAADARTGR